ncbi:Facilitated trehalose transporter Tret1-2 [Orchesella cincta]|uniref:Facilitated trehalose transporter Tret1-2 n=1 Tax=Orchesella cincta TaxID=48709 RepID=A0A1D2NMM2_ORCCI|nr:Facilitated trehalose transporter Tret1-2 [Orchesella cincta]
MNPNCVINPLLPTNVVRYTIPEKKPGYPWMESYAALVAALSFLCGGAVQSYTSGAIVSLQNDVTTNISVTNENIAWIASTPPLASLVGTTLSGPIMEHMGRRRTITLLALPLIIGWLIIGTAVNFRMILLGRFATGISLGMAKASAPVYVSETARAQHRGKLGYFPPIMSALGVLMGCILGSIMQWQQLALLMVVFPAVLFVASFFLPESPHWLIKLNQEDKAFQSLKTLRQWRGTNNDDLRIYKEITEIRESIEEVATPSFHQVLKDKEIRFPAMLIFCMMIFQQFSGVSAVIYYLKMILNHGDGTRTQAPASSHGTDIRPGILGLVHFLAFFISLPLVDRVGRKFLLKLSGILMTLSHIMLATYFYNYVPTTTAVPVGQSHGSTFITIRAVRNETISGIHSVPFAEPIQSWIPLATLCAYIASFSIASPIPFIVMSEIFGANLRSYMASAAIFTAAVASFIVVQVFPHLMYGVSPTFTFALFAFLSLQNTLVAHIMPETKGKTLAEIEHLFRAPRDFKGKFKENIEVECEQVAVSVISIQISNYERNNDKKSNNEKERMAPVGKYPKYTT